jgi:hypothetical protein
LVPPNPFPQNNGDFLNDPRIQMFGQQIAAHVMRAVNTVIGPTGRPVEVWREDPVTGAKTKQVSSSPQLLAELNDNIRMMNGSIHVLLKEMQELTDEIRQANEVGVAAVEDRPRRRNRGRGREE